MLNIVIKYFDYLESKSFTFLGKKLKKDRGKYYRNLFGKESFDHNTYFKDIKMFYHFELEAYCEHNNKNCFNELMYRRKEILNKNTYLANVAISLAFGILVGFFVNNIFGLGKFLIEYQGIFLSILKMTIYTIIIIIASSLPFFVSIVFAKFITLNKPIIVYIEEKELAIINQLLEQNFNRNII